MNPKSRGIRGVGNGSAIPAKNFFLPSTQTCSTSVPSYNEVIVVVVAGRARLSGVVKEITQKKNCRSSVPTRHVKTQTNHWDRSHSLHENVLYRKVESEWRAVPKSHSQVFVSRPV
jgi:hypothetical protein